MASTFVTAPAVTGSNWGTTTGGTRFRSRNAFLDVLAHIYVCSINVRKAVEVHNLGDHRIEILL